MVGDEQARTEDQDVDNHKVVAPFEVEGTIDQEEELASILQNWTKKQNDLQAARP